eukprot:gene3206-4017_t
MNSLSANEKKSIESVLSNKREEIKLLNKVNIVNDKKKKTEEKTLILGVNRIFLFSSNGKLSEDYHYLDINEIQSPNEQEISIKFKNQNIIKCQTNTDIGSILKCLYNTLVLTFPGIKIGKAVIFSVLPETRLVSIFQKTTTTYKESGGCGGFSLTYRSVCDYLGIQPLASIQWDMENLYPFNQVREINLSEIYQFSSADLKALFMSLSFNTYFTGFSAPYCKLSNEEMGYLSEALQDNTSVQQLSLSHVQASKESMIHLFNVIAENKAQHLSHVNVGNNNLENKGLVALGNAITTFTTPLVYLNIENTASGPKGLESLFNSLAQNDTVAQSLNHLAIGNNKLEAAGTTALCKLLLKTSQLQQLHMSNTSPVFSLLKNSAPSIQVLDFSGNKPSTAKEGIIDLLCFFKQMPNLNTVNLSKIQIMGDDLKLLFSPATSLLKVANVDLSDTELGDAGIIKLCEVMYPNSNLRHLSIDGNFKTRSKLRTRAIDAITNLIEDNCSIESLSIAAGNSKHQLKNDLVPFILSLLKNQSLLKLDITGNGIGDSGSLALSKVLWNNQTLRSVKCDGNDFSWTSIKMLKNSIKRNPKSVTMLPLPVSDICTILKNDNATLIQEKIQKTVVELQYSVINNLPTSTAQLSSSDSYNNLSTILQQHPQQPTISAKLSPIRKPSTIGSGGGANQSQQLAATNNSTNAPNSANNKTNSFSTLPLRRPVRPLYPGRTTVAANSSSSSSNDKGTATPDLPPIVSRSIDLLIANGTKTVGIFRTCASATQLKKIKARFEAGEDVDLVGENIDVDTVAGVLKSYFRELPIPVFPENLHEHFFQASRAPTQAEQIKAYKDIIDHLSPMESKMIKKLFLLLHMVSLSREENMMSPENIAICWAPTLFRSFSAELLPINSFLIVNYYDIMDPENKPKVEEDPAGSDIPTTTSPPLDTQQQSSPPPTPTQTVTNTISSGHSRTNSSFKFGTINSTSMIQLGSDSGSDRGSIGSKRSSTNSIKSNSSGSDSPTPSPPSSPLIDGTATIRSKRFSRVSRISYSPVLPRAWTHNESASRSVSSLFQEDLKVDDVDSTSGTSA